jgi:hypothetical protein
MEVRDGDVGDLGTGQSERFFDMARDFGGAARAEDLADAPFFATCASFDGVLGNSESASDFAQ